MKTHRILLTALIACMFALTSAFAGVTQPAGKSGTADKAVATTPSINPLSSAAPVLKPEPVFEKDMGDVNIAIYSANFGSDQEQILKSFSSKMNGTYVAAADQQSIIEKHSRAISEKKTAFAKSDGFKNDDLRALAVTRVKQTASTQSGTSAVAKNE